MATLDIPDAYLAAAPIIVTSPTTRCGTTLVQRLLSTSDNAFLYGEGLGNHFQTLTPWFLGVLNQVEQDGAASDADFQRALAGALDDWRPGLLAPTLVMRRAWIDTFYQMPLALSQFGRAIGRPIWGFKWPGYSRDMIRALLTLMPRAKVIYVRRNPVDALRSAKARKFVKTDDDVVKFCAEWARNMDESSALSEDERLLFLKYETLVEQREQQIRLLETFTGAENIKASVFEVKVNTFRGDEADGHSPTQYIEPEKLLDGDRAALFVKAAAMIEKHYPDVRVLV